MDRIVEIVTRINTFVNDIVWGWPALILLGVTGVWMTGLTRVFQVTHFKHWIKNTIGAIFKDKHVTTHTSDRTISQFQSLCTALAATVGTGNIVGVAGAIAIGGPGAVFWMWLIAFFGMMTSFSENVIGILYREKDDKGEWHGGAMYYLRNGLGAKKGCKKLGIVLAAMFSIFCILASFGIGNMSQINSMVANVVTAGNTVGVSIPEIAVGIFLFIAVGSAVIGGLKRIALVAEKLVPFMVVLYFLGTIIIIGSHISMVPAIFASIFRCAFSVKSVAGGGVGAGIMLAMKMGFKRGVFSNEAGLGSAVMVNASSNVTEPVRQGMWGIFEVFADTIFVCTLTAVTILTSGAIDLNTGEAIPEIIDKIGGSSSLMSYAFTQMFGPAGAIFIAAAILLFAYTTVLGWSHYGTTACLYLFGEKVTKVYRIIFVLMTLVSSVMKAQLAWDISDTFNGLMMIPNLIAIIVLAPQVVECTNNYLRRTFKGSDEEPMLTMVGK